MNKLIIFPFNGNGIEAMDCIGNEYELIAFADDTAEKVLHPTKLENRLSKH